jgi:transcriptional regulator of acetoin/glycerol metabolism
MTDDERMEELDRQWAEEQAERERNLHEKEQILSDLGANRERRQRAEAELEAAREELGDLLAKGYAFRRWPITLDVSEMARAADISRDTAHRRLREAGSISRRERNRSRWQGPSRSLEEGKG